MSGFYIGDKPLRRAFVGDQPVKSIWVGDQKVWPTTPEEIMYTVTSTVPSGNLNQVYEITNLKWLPDGDAATSVKLTAGTWVCFVWAAATTASDGRGYGVRTSSGDTFYTIAGGFGGSDRITATVFTLSSDEVVTVIARRTAQNVGRLLAPGDVIGFAPII